MLQTYLIYALIVCAIVLLVVLIVAAVQLVMIISDLRRVEREVADKVRAVSSILDVVSFLTGSFDVARSAINRKMPGKFTLVAFAAGLKKGLDVLLKK